VLLDVQVVPPPGLSRGEPICFFGRRKSGGAPHRRGHGMCPRPVHAVKTEIGSPRATSARGVHRRARRGGFTPSREIVLSKLDRIIENACFEAQ
jgi:hypothetical protein